MAEPIRLYPEGMAPPWQLQVEAACEYTRWSKLVAKGGHLSFPWGPVSALTGPLLPGWLVLVGARAKGGKAQPLDAKVLTRQGWKPMGQVKVGDELASVDGAPSVVEAVYPQGVKQVYRVTFSDGRSTECCADHLWCTQFEHDEQVITTAELAQKLTRKRYQRRLAVDLVSGDFGTPGTLPLDPWLLGVLIGDGGLTNATPILTTADPEVAEGVRAALPAGVVARKFGKYGYRLGQPAYGDEMAGGSVAVRRATNPLTAILNELGLYGHPSFKKFIPAPYMMAEKRHRIALLQGLLDTDGCVDSRGHLEFCTTSHRLAVDVQSLVRSLGGVSRITSRNGGYIKEGKRVVTRMNFRVRIGHAERGSLVRLTRKRDRAVKATRRVLLTVRSVVPMRETYTQCLVVSHPSHLYITDDYIVTHNSTFLRECLNSWVSDFNKRVLYVGTEQNAGILRALWACLRLRLPTEAALDPSHPGHAAVLDDVGTGQAKNGLADQASIVAVPDITLETYTQWARVAYTEKRDVLIFDHFHRLEAGGEGGWKDRNNSIRQIKNVASQSNMLTVVAAQLKNGEGGALGEYEVPGSQSWAETAGLRRECDVAVQLWRPFKPGITREQKGMARDDAAKLDDILQPNVMAVRCDAHRYLAAPVTRAARLYVNQGELTSWTGRTDL